MQYYDADDRVHVRYVTTHSKFEEGCFPGRLLNQFSLAPDKKDDIPPPSTRVQHTSGNGLKALEMRFYTSPDPRTVLADEGGIPHRIWTYDSVGRKRGA